MVQRRGKRLGMIIGVITALIWSIALLAGARALKLPFMPINVALIAAMVPPGLVLAAMIAFRALRHGLAPGAGDEDGEPAPTSSRAARRDARALTGTIEQLVLALCLWPFVALTLGGQVAIALGASLAFARLSFWAGVHASAALRAFGAAASFLPSLLAALWALAKWAL